MKKYIITYIATTLEAAAALETIVRVADREYRQWFDHGGKRIETKKDSITMEYDISTAIEEWFGLSFLRALNIQFNRKVREWNLEEIDWEIEGR